MALTNKTVTLLAANAKATSFTVLVQTNGSYVVTANGTVDDGAGFTNQLAATKSYPAGTTLLDNMTATALTELRKQNGLET
jgi:hypothetical protein